MAGDKGGKSFWLAADIIDQNQKSPHLVKKNFILTGNSNSYSFSCFKF